MPPRKKEVANIALLASLESEVNQKATEILLHVFPKLVQFQEDPLTLKYLGIRSSQCAQCSILNRLDSLFGGRYNKVHEQNRSAKQIVKTCYQIVQQYYPCTCNGTVFPHAETRFSMPVMTGFEMRHTEMVATELTFFDCLGSPLAQIYRKPGHSPWGTTSDKWFARACCSTPLEHLPLEGQWSMKDLVEDVEQALIATRIYTKIDYTHVSTWRRENNGK